MYHSFCICVYVKVLSMYILVLCGKISIFHQDVWCALIGYPGCILSYTVLNFSYNQPPWSSNILFVIFKSKWLEEHDYQPRLPTFLRSFLTTKMVTIFKFDFCIQVTNNGSLLGISYLRMSFSSFLSSSSVFEDVKLMSARRVTFEMNMTLAHLPVLSSDLCLTVKRKMKKNEEEKKLEN